MDDRYDESTVSEASVQNSAEVAPALVLVYSGELLSRPPYRYRLRVGETLIGRTLSERVGITLPQDRAVSRVHATMRKTREGDWEVEDHGSRNGTRVNGTRVGRATLNDGDALRVGDSFFIFLLSDAGRDQQDDGALKGVSAEICNLRQKLSIAAEGRATVLFLGETGTGKEVAAAELHRLSDSTGPFVAANCGAIPANLAESHLFGHVPGAFTGAESEHTGLFRTAHGGTLLLDEIGELPPELQPKLLRVVEDKEVMPVGASEVIPVDVRVIAATDRDLDSAVASGGFRAALLGRLAELVIEIPPLRKRREDVLLLLDHFLGEKRKPLKPSLVEALLNHNWPYNVRELHKVAVSLATWGKDAERYSMEHLGDRLGFRGGGEGEAAGRRVHAPTPSPLTPTPLRAEPPQTREACEQLLRRARGKVSWVAEWTQRSRRQVYRWVEMFDLNLDDFRE